MKHAYLFLTALFTAATFTNCLAHGEVMPLNKTLNTKKSTILTINHTWDGHRLEDSANTTVTLNWLKNGDLRILIDAPDSHEPKPNCESQSCWKLWEHEVVELFLVGTGTPVPYTEIEISPWGNYLVLQLLGARNTIAKNLPLAVSVQRDENRWQAEATLSSKLIPSGDLSVNAYRIDGKEPNRNYQVMTPLGGDKPDFHRIQKFKIMLKRQTSYKMAKSCKLSL